MKILYKKTNVKKVGFSTMAFTAKKLSWRFRHLNIVGCLLKRRPTKGGSRAPQDPPPPPPPKLRPCPSCLKGGYVRWTILYPVDSAIAFSSTHSTVHGYWFIQWNIVIHRLNNWGLRYNFVYRNKNSQVDKKMKDNLIGKKAIIEVA